SPLRPVLGLKGGNDDHQRERTSRELSAAREFTRNDGSSHRAVQTLRKARCDTIRLPTKARMRKPGALKSSASAGMVGSLSATVGSARVGVGRTLASAYFWRSVFRRSFEAQSHVHIDCTGPADRAAVWRNQTAGRLVDPTPRGLPGALHVSRLFDVGGFPG